MDGRLASQYEEFEKLKAEGKIRAYGVSLDWRAELELVLDTTKSQAAEVFFNALYQETLPAYPKAQEHGMGLIIKVPLDSGWLSGKYRANHKFDGCVSNELKEGTSRRFCREILPLLRQPSGRFQLK
jgi:aryl-alcohol dehydrogenase-like predicted oxidoreductase